MRLGIIAASLGSVLAGCDMEGDFGYAEIRINYLRPASDLFRLSSLALDELKAKNVTVVRQAVGMRKLELARNDKIYPLCSFDVQKNRIVTVTVSTSGGSLQCLIQ